MRTIEIAMNYTELRKKVFNMLTKKEKNTQTRTGHNPHLNGWTHRCYTVTNAKVKKLYIVFEGQFIIDSVGNLRAGTML